MSILRDLDKATKQILADTGNGFAYRERHLKGRASSEETAVLDILWQKYHNLLVAENPTDDAWKAYENYQRLVMEARGLTGEIKFNY